MMKTSIDPTRRVAHVEPAVARQAKTEPAFVDQRTEATAQRQLMEMLSTSPQAMQQQARMAMIANSPRTAQLKAFADMTGGAAQRVSTNAKVVQLAPDANPVAPKRIYTANGDGSAGQVEGQVKAIINGGTPSVNPLGWTDVLANAPKVKGSWVRFHLLNQWLGGEGNNTSNLVPTTVGINHNATWKAMEQEAQTAAANSHWVWWQAQVAYHAASVPKAHGAGFPSSVTVQSQVWDGTAWKNLTAGAGNYTLAITEPDFSGAKPERYFHEITGSQWSGLVGVTNVSLINALIRHSAAIKDLGDLDEMVYYNELYNFQNIEKQIGYIDKAIKGNNPNITILLEE